MDEFTRAYFECLVWTGLYFADETSEAESLAYCVLVWWDHLPEGVRAQIVADCEAFQEEAGDLIAADLSRAGHDFCLSRNRHGAGFWDGDWGSELPEPFASREVGRVGHNLGFTTVGGYLHDVAKSYGSQTLMAFGDEDDPIFELCS